MPKFLVSYDAYVADPNDRRTLVDALAERRWSYVYLSTDGVLKRLPDTTLWGEFANREAARDAFRAAIRDANGEPDTEVTLEKFAITVFEQRVVSSDKEKAPERHLVGATDIETCLNHQANDDFFEY